MHRIAWLILLCAMLAAGCSGSGPTGKFKDQDKPKATQAE